MLQSEVDILQTLQEPLSSYIARLYHFGYTEQSLANSKMWKRQFMVMELIQAQNVSQFRKSQPQKYFTV